MDLGKTEDENKETEEEFEPQITSDDPEERKLARQLRIQRRIEAIKKQHEQPEGQVIVQEEEKSLLAKQTEASAAALEQLLVEGEEVVTNVRIGNDTREVNRRAREAAKRVEILEKIELESKDAEERYEVISRKWDVISKYKDPLDISDNISLQRDLCNELIKQKDEIIAMLREEINVAEMKYVTDQEIQKDDITTLARRIDNQVDLMRKAYRHELQLIEETISTERQLLMDANNKKWEIIHKQRNTDEESNMHLKIKMADEFLQVFYDTRVEHEERYRETKIQLENEIEVLELELEQLKAACLLNGEKLDYNYNILKKREEENLIIRSQQKRVINKLQDNINRIRRHMRDYKAKSEEQINKLIQEIKKMRNSIFQIEDKADNICSVNDSKFQEVWELNEERAQVLYEKIKTTDRIIHEQLLCLQWQPPIKTFVKKTALPSYKEAMEELELARKGREESKFKAPNLIIEGTEIPHSLLQSILEKIAFHSGFLLENTLLSLLPELGQENKMLVQADNVFNTIGITKPEHLKIIEDLFLPYARCPICEQKENEHDEGQRSQASVKSVKSHSAHSQSLNQKPKSVVEVLHSDFLKCLTESTAAIADIVASELDEESDVLSMEEESTPSMSSETSNDSVESETKAVVGLKKEVLRCKSNHPIYVENAGVYKILRHFVRLGYENQEATMTLHKRLNKKRNSLSRLLSQDDIKMFWSQFSSMFDDTHEELWNGLLYGLKRYHAILEDRHNIYKEVVALRKENYELRHMLKYCNVEKKNKGLQKKSKCKVLSLSHI